MCAVVGAFALAFVGIDLHNAALVVVSLVVLTVFWHTADDPRKAH